MLQPQSCSSNGPCIFYCGGGAPAVADVFRGGGEVLVPTHHGPAVASGSTRCGRATSPTNVEKYHQMWAGRETAMDQESDDGDRLPPESYDRLPAAGVQDIVNSTKEIIGTWDDSPQGRCDKPHSYAVLCGNWGGNWAGEGCEGLHEHMVSDLAESPATILCLQEVAKSLCDCLKSPQPPAANTTVRRSYTQEGTTRREAERQPPTHFWCARGREQGESVAVAVRSSLFQGIRSECFILHFAGTYKTRSNRILGANNRILFTTAKGRYICFRGRARNPDEIGICCAQMHVGCAKKNEHEIGEALQRFV